VAGQSGSNDGNVTGNHGESDYWVIKLDGTGNLLWQKSLGGTGSDGARSIQQTSDGGYIVAGHSNSTDGDVKGNQGGDDYWIVKLDNIGNLTWQKAMGGTDTDIAKSIQQTSDGGYIVAGYSKSNGGDVPANNGEADYWIVKLTGIQSGTINTSVFQEIAIYPNPVFSQLTIDLEGKELSLDGALATISDLHGRIILEKSISSLMNTIDLADLSKGVYLLKIKGMGWQTIQKLVLD
jgi:hypothetical protein